MRVLTEVSQRQPLPREDGGVRAVDGRGEPAGGLDALSLLQPAVGTDPGLGCKQPASLFLEVLLDI